MSAEVVCDRPEVHDRHEWFSPEHSSAMPPAVQCPGRATYQAGKRRRAYSEEAGWTDCHREFRDWLITELRLAGCEIRTLSPEGMAQVTVEHMVRQGWEIRRTGR